MTGQSSVVNYALYQIGWLACVMGAARSQPEVGTLSAISLLLVHLSLASEVKRELRLIAAFGLFGAALDTLHSCLGVLQFVSGHWMGCVAPLWIIVMWMQFATLFRYCLRWVLRRYMLGALLGALGGPLAFWAGERLGAISFMPHTWVSLAVLAINWAIALPFLMWLAAGNDPSNRPRGHYLLAGQQQGR